MTGAFQNISPSKSLGRNKAACPREGALNLRLFRWHLTAACGKWSLPNIQQVDRRVSGGRMISVKIHTIHTQMFVKNCRIMLDSWILCWINRGNWFPSCAAEQRVPELGPNRDQVTATDVDQALLKPFHSPLDCQNYLTAVFRQVVSKSFIGVFVSKQFIHSFGSLRNDIYAACLVPLPMGSTIQHI